VAVDADGWDRWSPGVNDTVTSNDNVASAAIVQATPVEP
jgi:hypothetical protein